MILTKTDLLETIERKDQRVAELETDLEECRSVSTHWHGHTVRLEAENKRLRNFVEESGDNLIRVGVLLDKDAIIAELEGSEKSLKLAVENWREANAIGLRHNAELEAENERLRNKEKENREYLNALLKYEREKNDRLQAEPVYMVGDKYWNGANYFYGWRPVSMETQNAQLFYRQPINPDGHIVLDEVSKKAAKELTGEAIRKRVDAAMEGE